MVFLTDLDISSWVFECMFNMCLDWQTDSMRHFYTYTYNNGLVLQTETFGDYESDIFIGHMSFLAPNQNYQTTEDKWEY